MSSYTTVMPSSHGVTKALSITSSGFSASASPLKLHVSSTVPSSSADRATIRLGSTVS